MIVSLGGGSTRRTVASGNAGGRRRALAAVAVLALLGGVAVTALGPAPSASAQALLDSVSITKTSDSVFSAQVALSSSQTGRWEYRFIARDVVTGAAYQQSVTLAPEYGRSHTFTMTNLPSGTYDLSVEERVWGNDASMVVRATSRQIMGYLAPTGVSAASTASGSITVRWTPPTPAPAQGGYRVFWRPNGTTAVWSSIDVSGSSATQGALSGVTDGVLYDVRVTTMSGADIAFGTEHVTSAIVTARPIAVPDAPLGGAVLPADAGAHWTLTVPTSAARPSDASAVEFDYAVVGSYVWTRTYPSRTGDVWTFSDLANANGNEITLRARAVNAAGASGYTTVRVRPLGLPVAPSLGTPVRVEGALEVAATFPGTAAAPVTATEWQISAGGDGILDGWQPFTPVQLADGRYSTGSLSVGSEYRLRARSVNGVGASDWTETAALRAISAPTAPRISAPVRGDGKVTVSVEFGATSGQPSSGADAQWQRSDDEGATWSSAAATQSGTGWSISGLTNGTAYKIRVKAVNEVGSSSWSAPSTAVTPVSVPVSPSLGLPQIGDAHASVAVTSSSSASAPVDSLEWQISVSDGDAGEVWAATTPTIVAGTASFSALEPGVDYRVRVRAANDVGASGWVLSEAFTALARPLAPVVTAVTAAPGAIHVEASFPISDGRPSRVADSRWQVEDVTAQSGWVTVTPSPQAGGRFLIGDLADGHDYSVRVTASNAHGDATWTSAFTIRPISAPSTPSIDSVTARDGRLVIAAQIASPDSAPAASVTWQVAAVQFSSALQAGVSGSEQPPTAGRLQGGTPTGAPVHGWEATADAWIDATATVADGRYVLDGLTNGTSYRVRVAVANGSGSAVSASSSAVTPVSAPAAPIIRAVGTGRGSVVLAFSPTATVSAPVLALGWQIAAVSIGQVGAWRSVGSEDLGSALLTENGAPTLVPDAYRLGGLVDGQPYLVRVRAANASGVSAWTQWGSALIPAAGGSSEGGLIDPTPAPVPSSPPTGETTASGATAKPSVSGSTSAAAGRSVTSTATFPSARTTVVAASTAPRSVSVTSIPASTLDTDSGSAAASTADSPAGIDSASASASPAASVQAAPQEAVAGGAGLLAFAGLLGGAIRWYLRRRRRLRVEPPIAPGAV